MTERLYLNNHWSFREHSGRDSSMVMYESHPEEAVRIPHTCKELPFHYFDEQLYQMEMEYQRTLYAEEGWKGKKIFLTFEGVAHAAKVYVNGTSVGEHHCGYTAFTVELTDALIYEEDNLLTVYVDSRETLNQPPFGHVIDYMTYGGIYRDVYVEIREPVHIKDLFVKPKVDTCSGRNWLETEITIEGDVSQGSFLRQSYRAFGGREYQLLGEEKVADAVSQMSYEMSEVKLWSPESPNLYEIKTELVYEDKVYDERVIRSGFREARFLSDGFYLNGKKYKIFGLNRHQSYPYVGYAMPDSMQMYDADVLKYELSLNAVRTSHYPQSHAFLDRCDEIGLLVFTEIPGWQHIGDDTWKDQAVKNTEDMVRQYRNHTSIILWGVRINESKDDDDFYRRTNEAARMFDPTRQTGGVRAHKKSSLLEDVYTYNEFVHSGNNIGCEPKNKVTSDPQKPYMVTEYNGHMYPTKAFDCGRHRTNHTIRHATVINAVRKETDIAGSFGWCFADYNTHKDFGSGDRICYHGVMDMFRNPKLAAGIYTSQQDRVPFLNTTTSFDIGEQPAGVLGEEWIITNADEVRMYKEGYFVKTYKKEDSPFTYMKHGPILIDDFIGEQLDQESDYSEKQKDLIRVFLNEIARYGVQNLPKHTYVTGLKLLLRYRMTTAELTKLYERYIGNWGGTAGIYRLEAVKDGEVVKTLEKSAMHEVRLDVKVSYHKLVESKTYDVTAIRILALDEHGNVLPFYQEPIQIEVEGPIEIIGPKCFSLQGGMGGTYVKTTGQSGTGRVRITTAQTEDHIEEFEVEIKEEKKHGKR